MTKKPAIIIALILALLTLSACGGGAVSGENSKTVFCDNCTTELSIDADSNMNDEWIIYCEPCSEELFSGEDLIGDDILPEIPTAE